MSLKVHLGLDFWGAGNFGDDLMLAGLLRWIRNSKIDIKLTALCGHDLVTMQNRFPEINWYASDPISRELAINETDIWMGLGGSIFQNDVGPWLLDQTAANILIAKKRGIPTYLVGAGVNNRSALVTSQAQWIHALADKIWLRDDFCMQKAMLAGFSPEKTFLGSDVAHLAFPKGQLYPKNPTTAYVLHADPAAINIDAITYAIESDDRSILWFCQEARDLRGSEIEIFKLLNAKTQQQLKLLRPSYQQSSLDEIVYRTASWERTLSSRYHSSLAAAWTGSQLAIYERNDKLSGIREELGAECCHSLSDGAEMLRALGNAHVIPQSILDRCATRAGEMLLDAFNCSHPRAFDEKHHAFGAPFPILDFRDGWFPPESDGEHTWRWSSETSTLALYAYRPISLMLEGEWSSLIVPNIIKINLPDGTERSWEITRSGFNVGPFFQFVAPAGLSIIRFQTSSPGMCLPGDSRRLSIAWRNPSTYIRGEKHATR